MTSRLLIGLPSTLIYDCYLSWSTLEKLVAPDQNFLSKPIDAAKTTQSTQYIQYLLQHVSHSASVAWLDMCFVPLLLSNAKQFTRQLFTYRYCDIPLRWVSITSVLFVSEQDLENLGVAEIDLGPGTAYYTSIHME